MFIFLTGLALGLIMTVAIVLGSRALALHLWELEEDN